MLALKPAVNGKLFIIGNNSCLINDRTRNYQYQLTIPALPKPVLRHLNDIKQLIKRRDMITRKFQKVFYLFSALPLK